MGDKEKVVNILRDKTHGIKFGFIAPSGLRVSVDYSTFARVAEAVENDRILVVVRPPNMPENADGTYIAPNFVQQIPFQQGVFTRYYSGKFILRDVDSLGGEGNVVHEAVHASLDLTHNPNLMALENEAAAYIAQCLYYRNFNYIARGFTDIENQLWETARLIAFNVAGATQIPTATIDGFINMIGKVAPYNERLNVSYASDR